MKKELRRTNRRRMNIGLAPIARHSGAKDRTIIQMEETTNIIDNRTIITNTSDEIKEIP
jgi:hypothetical protein